MSKECAVIEKYTCAGIIPVAFVICKSFSTSGASRISETHNVLGDVIRGTRINHSEVIVRKKDFGSDTRTVLENFGRILL